jgi:hypothetical protein
MPLKFRLFGQPPGRSFRIEIYHLGRTQRQAVTERKLYDAASQKIEAISPDVQSATHNLDIIEIAEMFLLFQWV